MMRHTLECRSIDGMIQYTEKFWRRKAAVLVATRMASPFFDVLVDGEVVFAHTPPADFLERGRS
jgi:hypothetical protein